MERGGRVVARHIQDVSGKTLLPFIKENVSTELTVYTDEWSAYGSVKYNGFDYRTIQHRQHIYVNGDIHTNTIEGCWSLVKGGIRGMYRNVSDKYPQSYVNEYSFREGVR